MRERIGDWYRMTNEDMFRDSDGTFPFSTHCTHLSDGRMTHVPGNMKQVQFNIRTGECLATNEAGETFSIPQAERM